MFFSFFICYNYIGDYMNNKTRLNDKKVNIKLTIICALTLIGFMVAAIILGIVKAKEFTQYNQTIPLGYYLIMLPVIGGLFILFPLFALIRVVSNVRKAKKQNKIENKQIDQNKAFTYYRELPNNYGIGINTLLTDSTLENYKDIVAVVLDLCARKYLNLKKDNNKYILKVLKGIDDNLLSNEKYILTLILNNELKNIDYHEWINYCYADGKSLGLYEQAKVDNIKPETPLKGEDFKKGFKKIALIALFISLFFIISPITALGVFLAIFLFGSIFFYFYMIGKGLNNITKMSGRAAYEIEMKNQLTRTEKGKQELEKVFAFKAFIKDFSRFTEKHPEEVHLWDRYLSYAQVFGLTDEIMKSGYNELICNSSFIIDDFNNITLDNIVKEG